jgi:lipoic acid synthetase
VTGAAPSVASPKPPWLKVRLPSGAGYERVRGILKGLDLRTVCEEARCPNVAECWGGGTATVMLLGDTCTRGCRFCNVRTGNPRGAVDPEEPARVAGAVARLGLRYVVLTSVNRDDLDDGGAAHFAETVRAIRRLDAAILVETLIPDYEGEALAALAASAPDVIAHNVETVERLTPEVRDRARNSYRKSLRVLERAKFLAPRSFTKSSVMLGLGEGDEEVRATMRDLRSVGVEGLTIGQYLRPSSWHLPVAEYVEPARFEAWRREGEALGFRLVAAGPLVRSSYRAGEYFLERILAEARASGA